MDNMITVQQAVPSTSFQEASSTSTSSYQQPRPQQPQSTKQQQQQMEGILQFSINRDHLVSEDYYNIDSILATTENVACTFGPETPREFFPLIGQKAPESISEKGHRIQMPAWLLAAGIEDICQFSLPSAYNKVNREVVAAGAKTGKLEATQLVAKQRHFYLFGQFISSVLRTINPEQSRLIAEQLLDAFTQRIGPIIMRTVDINSKAGELLNETEKHIFHAIQESERLQLEWIRREHRPEDREADCNANRQRRAAKRKYGL